MKLSYRRVVWAAGYMNVRSFVKLLKVDICVGEQHIKVICQGFERHLSDEKCDEKCGSYRV